MPNSDNACAALFAVLIFCGDIFFVWLLQTVAEQLHEARKANETLQRDVERMEERARMLDEIELLKKRKLHIEFDAKRADLLVLHEQRAAKQVR